MVTRVVPDGKKKVFIFGTGNKCKNLATDFRGLIRINIERANSNAPRISPINADQNRF